MEDEKNFYVYIYFDPRKKGIFKYSDLEFEYEPFYVGKGTRYRMYSHLCEKHSSYKANKIKKLLLLNLDPIIIKFKDNLTNAESLKLEEELVNKIGRYKIGTGPLTNILPGGECTGQIDKKNNFIGKKHTEETKKRMSEARKEWYKNYPDEKKKLKKEKELATKKANNTNKFSFKLEKHTELTKSKISISKKGTGLGESNSQFGSFWITNGIESKKTKNPEIPEGWYKGRK